MRYSIEGQELVDIADALRRRHGETEAITGEFETIIISKTKNASSFDEFGGQYHETDPFYDVITIDHAETITIKIKYNTDERESIGQYVIVAQGNYEKQTHKQLKKLVGVGYEEITYTGDTITIYWSAGASMGTSNGYYAEVIGYSTTKDVRRTYQSNEIAQAIDDIEVGVVLPEEAYNITGNCTYKFAYTGWNWFIETFRDKITTENITNASNMFYFNTTLTNIPFELNFASYTDVGLSSMFHYCNKLLTIPKINNCKPNGMGSIFQACYMIRELPEDIENSFDWSTIQNLTSGYSGTRSGMFKDCYSLRSIPVDFLKYANPVSVNSYSYFYNGFSYCASLNDLINLPIPYTASWTSNAFSSTFTNCSKLKNITFAMPDGQPYVMKWKSQTIDLTSYVGYTGTSHSYILNYNSGITADKEVTDDATYQALKNDPDWWTKDINYSRYNHDSAVATINSLPDTSAYGTNTIKFKGGSGAKTDGGAINTLTEEEIAVATAKGWTVTLV